MGAGIDAGDARVDDATYVRRRRWSAQEKRAVVTESVASGNVIVTAKRHGIQAQQIYRWRERMEAQPAPAHCCPSQSRRIQGRPVRHRCWHHCWMTRAGIGFPHRGRSGRAG
ncbi:transposase [Methylobacterium sp. WL103]|nr:transposase [Methylobacterium sp. WL103]